MEWKFQGMGINNIFFQDKDSFSVRSIDIVVQNSELNFVIKLCILLSVKILYDFFEFSFVYFDGFVSVHRLLIFFFFLDAFQ